ncbi:MAG: DNA internalization-related competence protein ComEC/Rec2 [Pseudohongiellaceae bacterium]
MRAVLVSLIAGLASPALLRELPDPQWIVLAALFGLALAMLASRTRRLPWLAVILGCTWHFSWAYQQQRARLGEPLESVPIILTGEITGLPVQRERGQSFEFVIRTADQLEIGAKLRLSHFQNLKLRSGEIWQLKVKLKRPHGFSNPGVPNRELLFFREGIIASGYLLEWSGNKKLGVNPLSLSALRAALKQEINSHATDREGAGLLTALTIGDSSEINRDLKMLIGRLGLNHLFVISGMHIGLIAWLVFRMSGWLGRLGLNLSGLPVQSCAALASILASVAYAALAGWGLSTQRASVMIIVALAPFLLRRQVSLVIIFLCGVAVILFLDPLAVTDRGFWLSFSAVAVLLFVANNYSTRNVGRDAPIQALMTYWRPQWLIFLGLLLPLTILIQSVSALSPLINLVAIPVVGTFLTPVALLSSVMLALSPQLGAFMVGLSSEWLAVLIDVLWSIDRLVGEFQAIRVSVLSPIAGLCLAFFSAIKLLPSQVKLTRFALLLLAPLALGIRQAASDPLLRVDIFDVGQGLAVLVRTKEHTLIYDTGPSYGEDYDAGLAVVLPAMAALGVESLDKIVISHFDDDHSGGLGSVMAAFPEAELDAGGGRGELHSPCLAGETWVWDSVEFSYMSGESGLDERRPWPAAATGSGGRNDGSCVLLIKAADRAVLLPGDISQHVERALAMQWQSGLKSNLLIASHHGSKGSSSYPFLKMVSAEFVVFSNGYKNGFNHPHPQVESRARSLGMRPLATSETGMQSYRFVENEPEMFPLLSRCTSRYYWSWSGNRDLCR